MTLRNAPRVGRDGKSYSLICISEKQKYFCKWDWTGHNCRAELICPSGSRLARAFEAFELRLVSLVIRLQTRMVHLAMMEKPVGWEERSDTHHVIQQGDGFRKGSTHPTS
jgi:hypothetical protein